MARASLRMNVSMVSMERFAISPAASVPTISIAIERRVCAPRAISASGALCALSHVLPVVRQAATNTPMARALFATISDSRGLIAI